VENRRLVSQPAVFYIRFNTSRAAKRMSILLNAYNARIAAGALQPDPAQIVALRALQTVLDALVPAGVLVARAPRRWPWLKSVAASPVVPRGLYLYGSVGRGKSMLMDLFFAHAPLAEKKRVHFHAFMQEIHAQLQIWRQQHGHGADPLPELARQLAARYRLLCFDEFYVSDIADAMILARLFTALFAAGIVLVATSNTAPDALYADGLQRAQFLPFIAVLQAHVSVLQVEGAVDHRLECLGGQAVYFTPLGTASDQALAKIFAQLTDHAPPVPEILPLQGRALLLPRTAHGVLWSSFADLCEQPLGAPDYLAVARHFRAVVLNGVPQLQADARNATVRFITLIDALYEAKTKLIMAASVPPQRLAPTGAHAAAFNRTASRLHEMQSAAYLALPHLGAAGG
jgi:cell division protein ZapE